jgi:protein O-mannosyl-transferase
VSRSPLLRGGWTAALLVAAVAAAVNLAALRPGFIHDDHRIVEQNEWIRDLGHLPEIFRNGYWTVDARSVPNLYRPVTILSFALNHAVSGLAPLGYRLTNLALHVLCALLLLVLARRLLEAPAPPVADAAAPPHGAALLAGLLFAVHPVHAEVLGEVVGRAELLAAAGTLAGVIAFLRGRGAGGGRGRWAWYATALGCFAVAALSKENGFVAPILALLADRLLAPRPLAWRFHAAAAALLAACLALRVAVLGGIAPVMSIHPIDNPIVGAPFLQGRLTAIAVLGRYARLLVWPAHQSIDYSFDAIPLARGLLDPRVLFGLVVVLGWGVGLACAWRRAPRAAFACAWIGVALLPVANLIVPIGTIMAERLLYLPSAGVALLAAAGGGALERRWRGDPEGSTARRHLLWRAGAALLLVALAARNVRRLHEFRDDFTIFRAALAAEPRSVRSLFNYASSCETRGEEGEAVRAYLQAIALWPGFADAHYNLAGVYARQGQWSGAVDHYREAVRREPGNVQYLVNLGHALIGAQRAAEGASVLERALTIDPRSVEALTNLGAARLAEGDTAAALRAYAEAVRLRPGDADYLRNLALARDRAGDTAGAITAYRGALALRPGDPDLEVGLGLALQDGGEAAAALQAFEAAVRAAPAQPIYRHHLGRALERSGRLQEAEEQYRAAVRLAPASPVPLRSLGLLLDRRGDRQGALQALQQAERLATRASGARGSGDEADVAEARRVLERLRRLHP